MKAIINRLIVNYPYTIAVFLFAIGILIIIKKSNLFKKLIGLSIMESSIFIMFVSSGYIRGESQINPLPSALMLTGIVVGVSVTAFGLALIIKLYDSYGTVDSKKIEKLRKVGGDD